MPKTNKKNQAGASCTNVLYRERGENKKERVKKMWVHLRVGSAHGRTLIVAASPVKDLTLRHGNI